MTQPLGAKLSRRPVAVYIVAALGFLFFGLLGHDFPPYLYLGAALAIVGFVQTRFQNFAVWLAFLILYAAGAIYFAWILIADLIVVAQHGHGRIFLDFDDSAVFVGYVALMIGVTIWLLRSRPRPHAQASDV
jgi:hypothetical protein